MNYPEVVLFTIIDKTFLSLPVEHTVYIKQLSNTTTYLSSTIQYQCKSTRLQMGTTAVPEPTLNSTHIQYLCGEIVNTLRKETVLIGYMN